MTSPQQPFGAHLRGTGGSWGGGGGWICPAPLIKDTLWQTIHRAGKTMPGLAGRVARGFEIHKHVEHELDAHRGDWVEGLARAQQTMRHLAHS